MNEIITVTSQITHNMNDIVFTLTVCASSSQITLMDEHGYVISTCDNNKLTSREIALTLIRNASSAYRDSDHYQLDTRLSMIKNMIESARCGLT